MSNYWAKRQAEAQAKLTTKNIKETEIQLKKYYSRAMHRVISDFESTYDKLLATVSAGKEPTPADCYKLDKYWKMQAGLRDELQKLGDKQAALFSKRFVDQYEQIYNSIALKGDALFTTYSREGAEQMIKSIWCADGKNWSSRIWTNTDKLQQTLNDNLIECIVTGKKTTELKQILIKDFNASFKNADMLVRTEMAHIQTQAAQQRYKDYGIEMVEVFVDEDERTCPICAKHEGEQYPVNAQMPVPFHPRCRCCMIPVISDNEVEEEIMFDKENKELDGYVITCKHCGRDFERQNLTNFALCPHCQKPNYNPDESKYIYKDKDGNKKYYTKAELKKEEEELRQMARDRAASKTTMGTTADDAYTTKPLQKQIREAYDKEGEFTYYTHHCNHCGRYFNSTVQAKKKCPLCGGSIDWMGAKQKNIIIKKCAQCGKRFNDVEKVFAADGKTTYIAEGKNTLCKECRDRLLSTREAITLKKHGYTDRGAIAKLTGQSYGWQDREYEKPSWDLYWEYIKKHPERQAELSSMDSSEYKKHFYVCIDCGEVFYTENKNNTAKRCPECQAEYRRKYKAEKERERRKRKKN